VSKIFRINSISILIWAEGRQNCSGLVIRKLYNDLIRHLKHLKKCSGLVIRKLYNDLIRHLKHLKKFSGLCPSWKFFLVPDLVGINQTFYQTVFPDLREDHWLFQNTNCKVLPSPEAADYVHSFLAKCASNKIIIIINRCFNKL
jgi:hypothetical protein